MLEDMPDHFKTQKMGDGVVMEDSLLLRHVPDWFVAREQIQVWCDKSEYCDNFLGGTTVIKNGRPKKS